MIDFETIKHLIEMLKKQGQIESANTLLALQAENIELKTELFTLREKVQRLEVAPVIEEEFIFDDGAYYEKCDTERKKPFCVACWEERKKRMPMKTFQLGYNLAVHRCPVCYKG